MNERVYIESSVVSYLTSRPSRDLVIAAHQELTRQWWTDRGIKFDLFISELVLEEVRRGDPVASATRVDAVEKLSILSATPEAVVLADGILAEGSFPREAAADALHIAIASVNGMDYLLTWNCKHLANATHRNRVENYVEGAGYACPVICTPEELMED